MKTFKNISRHRREGLNRGFTLIELLVVIAIIGILASVVLASLNTARTSGSNANIKANLSNVRAAAELHYATNGTYANLCAASNTADAIMTSVMNNSPATSIVRTLATAGTATTVICHENGTAGWAIAAPMNPATGTKTYFCVDGTGKASETNTALPASAVSCTIT